MAKQRSDRCFTVPAKGDGVLRVRAPKRPTGKTLVALQDLFDAAHKHLSKHPKELKP